MIVTSRSRPGGRRPPRPHAPGQAGAPRRRPETARHGSTSEPGLTDESLPDLHPRPVATTLLMAAILHRRHGGLPFLPLSALPEVDYPTIQVQTFYPGASPDVMTSSVTAPLERQLGQMPGLKQMSSTSSAGASVITLQFALDLSLDVAEQEVQAAINAAGNLLPSDLPTPPVYAKVNPADAPVLTLALTSKTLPLTEVEDLADTRLAQKISQLPGVGLVSIGGGQRQSMRIRVNPAGPRRLRPEHRRPAHDDQQWQREHGQGQFRRPVPRLHDQRERPAQDPGRLPEPDHRLPERRARSSSPMSPRSRRAGEHQARGLDRTRPRRSSSTSSASPGANVIKVVDSVRALLPTLQASLPPAVDVGILTDRTTTIRASIHDVEFELTLAVDPGRPGDLRLPAQHPGHGHPQPLGPPVARRHVRRHVPARASA